MSETFEAIYEGGVFRPLVPVNLPEGQLVRVNANSPSLSSALPDVSPLQTLPVLDDAEEDDAVRPWRGVYALTIPHQVVSSERVDLNCAPAKVWEPHIWIDPR